jgi:hypothetical protein
MDYPFADYFAWVDLLGIDFSCQGLADPKVAFQRELVVSTCNVAVAGDHLS